MELKDSELAIGRVIKGWVCIYVLYPISKTFIPDKMWRSSSLKASKLTQQTGKLGGIPSRSHPLALANNKLSTDQDGLEEAEASWGKRKKDVGLPDLALIMHLKLMKSSFGEKNPTNKQQPAHKQKKQIDIFRKLWRSFRQGMQWIQIKLKKQYQGYFWVHCSVLFSIWERVNLETVNPFYCRKHLKKRKLISKA